MIAAAAELMMEQVVWAALGSRISNAPVAMALMDRCQGLHQLKRVFKDVVQESVDEVLRRAGFASFAKDWQEIAQARNSVAHGEWDVSVDGARLMSFAEALIPAGAALWNAAVRTDARPAPVTFAQARALTGARDWAAWDGFEVDLVVQTCAEALSAFVIWDHALETVHARAAALAPDHLAHEIARSETRLVPGQPLLILAARRRVAPDVGAGNPEDVVVLDGNHRMLATAIRLTQNQAMLPSRVGFFVAR